MSFHRLEIDIINISIINDRLFELSEFALAEIKLLLFVCQ
jgi:hypothetical protein